MTKEKTIKEYDIKIYRVFEQNRDKFYTENKDKMFLVNIKEYGGRGLAFGVPAGKHYGKSLKQVFKEIVKNLNL